MPREHHLIGTVSGVRGRRSSGATPTVLNNVVSLAIYLRITVPMYQTPRPVNASSWPVIAVRGLAFGLTILVGLAV